MAAARHKEDDGHDVAYQLSGTRNEVRVPGIEHRLHNRRKPLAEYEPKKDPTKPYRESNRPGFQSRNLEGHNYSGQNDSSQVDSGESDKTRRDHIPKEQPCISILVPIEVFAEYRNQNLWALDGEDTA